MAELNLKYYKNTDVYSDGSVEEDILDIVKGGKNIEDYYDRYAVIYHLSPVRENIVNWYPFREGSTCLEIGAGCGAITGALCRKNKQVVSVDISKRRCEINYHRHRDMDNLEIIPGNIHEISFNQGFDYIVLNGVFEYALSFTHTTGNPYIELLTFVKGLLKPHGRVLIAIENRLGLKYFSGAPEDHTDEYFLGLNGYVGNDSVRTFSKKELRDIIEKCGFSMYKFYYPYPDYKFPGEIFTDATVNDFKYGRPYYSLNPRVFALFEESRVAASLAEEGITDRFANSFLVEMGTMGEPEDVIYAKLNTQRNEAFRVGTLIHEEKGHRYVEKCPLSSEAQEHIKGIYTNSLVNSVKGIRNCSFVKKGDAISYDYYNYKNLDDIILEDILNGDVESIKGRLRAFFDPIGATGKYVDYHGEKFTGVFGNATIDRELLCVRPANIDLICDNIMPVENGYIVIDTEWIFDMDVPFLFIVWRNIRELYTRHQELNDLVPFKDFLDSFNIDEELSSLFLSWTLHFVEGYVGNGIFERVAVNRKYVDLNKIYFGAFNEAESSLYMDWGKGYNEEDKLTARLNVDNEGRFTVRFDLPEGNPILRWDPVEGRSCKCAIDYINGEAEAVNAAKEGDYDLFKTNDPSYRITTGERQLIIRGRISIEDIYTSAGLFATQAESYRGELAYKDTVLEQRDMVINRLNEDKAQVEKHVDELKVCINKLEDEADTLRGEISDLTEGNSLLMGRIEESNKTQSFLTERIEGLKREAEQERQRYNEIINSRGWRFLDRLRRIGALFRR